MSNTKDFDILVINRKNNNQYAIHVKKTSYKKKEWTLWKKNEDLIDNDLQNLVLSKVKITEKQTRTIKKYLGEYLRDL